ncbi:MAG: PQQ-dependent sugar dehydrogenase [Solirubrobacterales bacterium]
MRLSLARAAAAFGFAGIALLVAWTATSIGVPAAGAATLPTGFEERTVASGLTAPTAVDWAPDGRMFVAEKAGRVRVVTAGGSLVSTPLLDISDHVHPSGDRGLLGLAVDSGFTSNRYLYLLYTYDTSSSHPTGPKTSRLTRVTVNSNNTASAETVLVGSIGTAPCPAPSNTSDCIPSDGGSHSIGTVRSAPDGTVWAGSGDGSDYGRVDERALRTHDEQSFAGKLIHVDRNGRGLPGHPFCPAEADLTKVCTKVWAKGFRNPFRFTLRPSGLPAVGDVGWGSAEEMNLAQAGRNYGWPCYEGRSRVGGYSGFSTCTTLYSKEGTSAGVTFPDYHYSHSGSGAAIVGGPTYPGGPYPDEFDGDLFFGDYVRGWIKRMEFDGGGRPADTKDFATGWYGVDLELWGGELYYADFGDGSRGQGSVRRISYSPDNRSPIAVAEAAPTSGGVPLTVRFKGSGSSDPEGGTLRYDWNFDDGTSHSTSKDPSHSYSKTGEFDARLTVRDPAGASDTATVHVSVGNTPPTATIAAPTEGSKYRNGVPVQLTGSATDKEDGTLADGRLSWHVVLVHADHAHDFTTLEGKQASFTPWTDHDADSHYRVTLTATDSKGVSASKTVTIAPETIDLTIASVPAGAPITYAGYAQVAAPYSSRAAIGFLTTVGAADRFSHNGRLFVFEGWSDGGAISHDISMPAQDVTLTARYRDTSPAFTATPSGLQPGGDKLGPVVRLRSRRPSRNLTGTVTDPAGVRHLRVALRATGKRRGCHWWSRRAGHLTRRARCAKPRWMKAKLKRVKPGTWAWSVKLGGRLSRGRYRVRVRAVDRLGNVSRTLAGRSRLRVGRRPLS